MKWIGTRRSRAKHGVAELLESLSGVLPNEHYEIACDYVDHNEWGLGLEHALDQLIELELTISDGQYAEVERLCKLMDLPNSWASLATNRSI